MSWKNQNQIKYRTSYYDNKKNREYYDNFKKLQYDQYNNYTNNREYQSYYQYVSNDRKKNFEGFFFYFQTYFQNFYSQKQTEVTSQQQFNQKAIMFFSNKNVFNVNKDKKSNREQFQHQLKNYQNSKTDSQWQFEKRDQRVYFENDEWNEEFMKKSYEFEKKKFYENNDEFY